VNRETWCYSLWGKNFVHFFPHTFSFVMMGNFSLISAFTLLDIKKNKF
jgi:hypothetical protein